MSLLLTFCDIAGKRLCAYRLDSLAREYGVEVRRVTGEGFFPPEWLEAPISATASDMAERELDRMAAFAVTVQDLQGAFQREHVRVPGGFMVATRGEDLLKVDLEFHDLASLENMIVAHRDGAPIRLRDVARVSDLSLITI